MYKKISVLLIFIIITISLASCKTTNKEIKNTQQFFSMDTIIDITIYGENHEKAFKECNEEINRLDKLFSVNKKDSDIYKINHSNGKSVDVSKDTIDVIQSSIEISKITNGDFDITIYPLVKLYGFTTDKYYAPTQSKIEEKLKLVNYKDIKVKGDSISIKPKMQLDLGAIAKGYTGKKIKEVLINNSVEKAIISLGGNVETVGTKGEKDKWQIGVQNPDGEDIIMTIGVDETSVITSGAYRRNVTIDDKFYHHIIDPKNGKPADKGVKSVTIVGKDSIKGDALSTAVYVKGTEKGLEFYKENKGIYMVMITQDNKIYVSKELKENVKIEEMYKKDYEIKYI